MKQFLALLSFTFLLVVGFKISAAESTRDKKLADFEKACLAQKKSKAVCACVKKNFAHKVTAGEFSDEQLDDAISAMRLPPNPADDLSPRFEHIADYVEGLVYHCEENPKYSIE